MAVPDTDIEVIDPEEDRIVSWRQEELQRAGYDRSAARRLARRFDVDLHQAVGLLKQGCEPALALRILL